jgi:hypothetical protein
VSAAAAGEAPVAPPRGVPHSLQNLAPGLFVAPQFGQPLASGEPHSLQNFEPASFWDEQTGQITR